MFETYSSGTGVKISFSSFSSSSSDLVFASSSGVFGGSHEAISLWLLASATLALLNIISASLGCAGMLKCFSVECMEGVEINRLRFSSPPRAKPNFALSTSWLFDLRKTVHTAQLPPFETPNQSTIVPLLLKAALLQMYKLARCRPLATAIRAATVCADSPRKAVAGRL